MVNLLAAAALAAAAPQSQPHPALWVVRDADTTVYIFGTFHALDARTQWFSDDVKSAFDAPISIPISKKSATIRDSSRYMRPRCSALLRWMRRKRRRLVRLL